MSKNVLEISDQDFEKDVLQSDIPVIVDFWAPWCGPCKSAAPILEEVAGQYVSKVKFMKCNTDDHQKTPSKYGVQSIPTFIFYKGGEAVHRLVGVTPAAKMKEEIKTAFGIE